MFKYPLIRNAIGISILSGSLGYALCDQNQERKIFDVAIVGGGLAGLAIARECGVRGHSVILLEKQSHVACGASAGNSGLGHTGYDAPEGSLESRLLRRSIRLHQSLYRSFGLSHSHVRKSGALVVAWNEEQLAKLPHVLEENRAAGDISAEVLSQEDLRDIEPSLARHALGAVLCPFEAVVEPWLVVMGYLESARIHGVRVATETCVMRAVFDRDARVWQLGTQRTREHVINRSTIGSRLVAKVKNVIKRDRDESQIQAKVVINAAGIFGDDVERLRCAKVPFTVTPRKGQFLVFDKCPSILNFIVEPVSSQFTKGIIVWKSIYGNIIVGPTAVDQKSKDDMSTDAETMKHLEEVAKDLVPALRDVKVIGSYSGLRPATEYRDYQIQAHPEDRWITVAGIRSTGLSCASGIGEYVADLHDQFYDPSIRPWADRVDVHDLPGVSESAVNPIKCYANPNGTVPSLDVLAKDFREHGDGTVLLYGKRMLVTHPLSSFGLQH